MKLVAALSLALVILFFTECSKKATICPAFSSYYIHDDKVREEMFSYFVSDSTEPEQTNAIDVGDQEKKTESTQEESEKTESTGSESSETSTMPAAPGSKTPKGGWDVPYQKSGVIGKNKPTAKGRYLQIPKIVVPCKPLADYRDTIPPSVPASENGAPPTEVPAADTTEKP